jgi:hypothetical protein
MSAKTSSIQRLTSLLLIKSGIERSTSIIEAEIEESIKESYAGGDNEEDDSYPSYGGIVYGTFKIVTSGKIHPLIGRSLSDRELSLILSLSINGDLHVFASRTNSEGQEWMLSIGIPTAPNESDSKRLNTLVRIKPSKKSHGPHFEVSQIGDDFSEIEIEKLLLVYTLAL